MTTTSGPTFDPSEAVVCPVVSSQSPNPRLEELPRKFAEAAAAAPSNVVSSIVAMAAEELGAVVAVACQEKSEGRLLPTHVYSSASRSGTADAVLPELMEAARMACRARSVKWTRSVAPHRYQIVAVPTPHPDRPAGAVVFCLPPEIQPADRVTAVAMYAAAWLCLATTTQLSPCPPTNASVAKDDLSAALLQIYCRAAAAPDLFTALLVLVNELQCCLGCETVCLTFPHGGSDARVVAISRVTTFDRRSSLVAAIEAAARETMLLDRTQVFPGRDEAPASSNLGELCRQAGCPRAWSWPCKDATGKNVFVCLVLLPADFPEDDSRLSWMNQSADILGATLALLRQNHESLWRHAVRKSVGALRALRRRRSVALAVALIALLTCAPWPYHLPCECVVEPVTRRIVSAPFDGVLDRTLVRPGDRVNAGDELALMDGRELSMQLASRQALRNQSRQRYTAALAKRDATSAQLALMEIQQTEQEVGLLEHRRENLVIRSPLDGIVVSGDLHRAAGAPLTVGQKLFEIAPLDHMVVEASVPEHEVGDVEEGQSVSLSLESHPGVRLRGSVTCLHPQAELRDQNSVFVAEVELTAADVPLLPGMSGQAHIDVGSRSVAWILFHRPWHYLRSKFVW
ncbi:MAG: HlyD family efflux transporter periplasmic adaptor subunit [Pirellulales bacterium]